MKKLLALSAAALLTLGLGACSDSNVQTATGTNFKKGTDVSTQQFLDTYKPVQSSIKAVHAVTTVASPTDTSKNTRLDCRMDTLDPKNKKTSSTVTSNEGVYQSVTIANSGWVRTNNGPWKVNSTVDPSTGSVFTGVELFSQLKSDNSSDVKRVHYDGKDAGNDRFTVTLSNAKNTGTSDVIFEFNTDKFLVVFTGTMDVENKATTMTMNQDSFNTDQKIVQPSTK